MAGLARPVCHSFAQSGFRFISADAEKRRGRRGNEEDGFLPCDRGETAASAALRFNVCRQRSAHIGTTAGRFISSPPSPTQLHQSRRFSVPAIANHLAWANKPTIWHGPTSQSFGMGQKAAPESSSQCKTACNCRSSAAHDRDIGRRFVNFNLYLEKFLASRRLGH